MIPQASEIIKDNSGFLSAKCIMVKKTQKPGVLGDSISSYKKSKMNRARLSKSQKMKPIPVCVVVYKH
jgi:ribosomal protein L14